LTNGHAASASPQTIVAGTGGVVMGVPSLVVSQGHPLHELGEVTIAARPEQEVEMIGHRAVGQQPHAVPGHCFSQGPAVNAHLTKDHALSALLAAGNKLEHTVALHSNEPDRPGSSRIGKLVLKSSETSKGDETTTNVYRYEIYQL
jgi:hypothetical protein